MRPEDTRTRIVEEVSYGHSRCRICKCKLRDGEVVMEIANKPCHRFCVHGVLQDSYTEIPQLPSEDVSLAPEGMVAAYRAKLLEQWNASSEDEQAV